MATSDQETLLEWAATARRGEVFEYARGDLAILREEYRLSGRNDRYFAEAGMIYDAGDAWKLHESRKVALFQRRLSPGCFAYVAVKR